MQLFQLKNYNVIFDPITMTISPFAAIRDKNGKDEELTMKEMAFIWFFTDVRSHYMSILNEDDREEAIREGISLPSDWRKTDELLTAIKYYRENSKTPSSGLYEASVISAAYIEELLKEPKELLEKTDGKGNYIYKLDNVTKMLKDLPEIMKKLHEARVQVIKELEENTGLKGGKTAAVFENGI